MIKGSVTGHCCVSLPVLTIVGYRSAEIATGSFFFIAALIIHQFPYYTPIFRTAAHVPGPHWGSLKASLRSFSCSVKYMINNILFRAFRFMDFGIVRRILFGRRFKLLEFMFDLISFQFVGTCVREIGHVIYRSVCFWRVSHGISFLETLLVNRCPYGSVLMCILQHLFSITVLHVTLISSNRSILRKFLGKFSMWLSCSLHLSKLLSTTVFTIYWNLSL